MTYIAELDVLAKAVEPYRCGKCGRILFKASLPPGSVIEVKCHCNTFTTVAIPIA